mmetsp:Transcript_3114/g.4765  ORF Transcript_3114/g.4765 Transcript_3114/m.4765 type:complete len:82 (-) Transcript_3114:145-390(-)
MFLFLLFSSSTHLCNRTQYYTPPPNLVDISNIDSSESQHKIKVYPHVSLLCPCFTVQKASKSHFPNPVGPTFAASSRNFSN